MRLAPFLIVAIVALTAVAAPSAQRQANARSQWDTLRRPLHLPKLRPGERCPTSRVRPFAPPVDDVLVGSGPAYLLIGSSTSAVGAVGFDIGLSWRDSAGWRGTKTPWEIKSSYRGRILIRGSRIDRAGSVRFGDPPVPNGAHEGARELHWGAGVDHDPGARYRGLAAGTLFRSPGCYAFQADGASFSAVVVVAVTDRMRRT